MSNTGDPLYYNARVATIIVRLTPAAVRRATALELSGDATIKWSTVALRPTATTRAGGAVGADGKIDGAGGTMPEVSLDGDTLVVGKPATDTWER